MSLERCERVDASAAPETSRAIPLADAYLRDLPREFYKALRRRRREELMVPQREFYCAVPKVACFHNLPVQKVLQSRNASCPAESYPGCTALCYVTTQDVLDWSARRDLCRARAHGGRRPAVCPAARVPAQGPAVPTDGSPGSDLSLSPLLRFPRSARSAWR